MLREMEQKCDKHYVDEKLIQKAESYTVDNIDTRLFWLEKQFKKYAEQMGDEQL